MIKLSNTAFSSFHQGPLNHVNGMPVFLEAGHQLPVVDFVVTLKKGTAADPSNQLGLTFLTWALLRKGTRDISSDQVEEAIDRMGARLGIDVQREHIQVHGWVLKRHLDTFVDLLCKLLRAPAFRKEDLEQKQREIIARQLSIKDDDRSLTQLHFRQAMFRGHSYANPIAGWPSTLPKIRVKDVRAHYKNRFSPGQVSVGFSGDLEPTEATHIATRLIASLPLENEPASAGPKSNHVSAPKAPRKGRHITLVSKPDRAKSQILIGTAGTHTRDPWRDSLTVANTAFGGTFTSKLTQEVREKRGWSYGASSGFTGEHKRGAWYMSTFPATEQTLPCIQLQLKLVEQWVMRGMPKASIEFAKNYLLESHCFDVDTPAKRLDQVIFAWVLNRPLSKVRLFPERIRAVTHASCKEAVQARIDPNRLQIVLVGSEEHLAKGLAKLPGTTTLNTLPHDRIDLSGRT